jgi:hypothetical protein
VKDIKALQTVGSVAAVLLFAACVPREDSMIKKTYNDEMEEYCNSIADVGESVMAIRQMGISLENQLAQERSLNSRVSREDREFSKIMRNLILDAYEVPRFETKGMQERATIEFHDAKLLECLRSM